MRSSIYIKTLSLVGLLLLMFSSFAGDKTPLANNGIINLSDYNFEKKGNAKLKGKWKFYWERFVTPGLEKNDSDFCFIEVPKNWKGQMCNNNPLPVYGFGTYSLQIIIGKEYRDELLKLTTRYIPNASAVYINGKLIGEGGKTGKDKTSTHPSLQIIFSEFIPDSDTLFLTIHVTSYNISKGGIYYGIELGLAKDIIKTDKIETAKNFFIIGGIFLMMLYYFIMFLIRKKDKSSLFFGVLCFFVAVYALCLSDLFYDIFSSFSFSVNYKIKHIIVYIALLSMSLYVYNIFRQEFSKIIVKIIIVICFIPTLAMLIFDVNMNASLFSYFRYFGIIITIYLIFVIIKAKIRKRDGAGIIISGFIILFLTIVNDSLHSVQMISTTDLMPLGMFLFLFLQTYLLSSRFNNAFVKTEELSAELKHINKNLEKIVEERTAEVVMQKHEIEEKNEELSQLLEEVITQRDEIEAQRDLVTNQKEKIEVIHHEISQSIDYAKRIQQSILSDTAILKKNVDDYFVLFRPKDKVSGDFYWWNEVEGHLVVTAADCTGHGVPGSFMSMLGISFLREIIIKEYIVHPGIILKRLRKEIINVLKQKGVTGEQKDGMDMALVSINLSTKMMEFSGANNPLYLIRSCEANEDLKNNETTSLSYKLEYNTTSSNQLIEIKGDKMPIAIYERMDKFDTKEIQLKKGDQLYMFSDGYADQFGGPAGKKFKYKSFKELLLKNSHLDMEQQKNALENGFIEWIGNLEQIDDVVVIGIRI